MNFFRVYYSYSGDVQSYRVEARSETEAAMIAENYFATMFPGEEITIIEVEEWQDAIGLEN